MTAASVVSLPVPAVVGICDQKWKPLMYFEQTFHLLNALVGLLRSLAPAAFGTIHGGSAAKCNDCLGSFCQIQLSGLLHIPDSGIGHSSVIDTIRNIVFPSGSSPEMK